MAIEWSGLGPGLMVRLDRSARQPLRGQLEASLREAIRNSRLLAGERLPSSRELARTLGVSRGMVQECYGQLLAEGYLTSRTGFRPPGSPASAASRPGRPTASLWPRSRPRRPGRSRKPPLIADLQLGVPDLSSFPRTDWAWGDQAGVHPGPPPLTWDTATRVAASRLREVLAGYLRRVRAAAASPAQMIISTGFAQGVNLVLHALARQGSVTRVAFEDPGYGSAQVDETVRAALGHGHRRQLPAG